MKLLFRTVIIFFLLFSFSQATFENWGETALTNSMGGEGVALGCEAGGISYNPASLGLLKKGMVQFGYCQLFNLRELETRDLYLAFPRRRLTYGMGVFIFGKKDYYQETILAFSLAYRVKKLFSLGINMKYMKVSFNSKYDDLSAMGLDGGVVFQPSEKVGFGLALRNFNQPSLVKSSKDVPFSWAVGTTIAPFDSFRLSFNLSKEKRYPVRVHLGQEIKILSNLYLRAGMASQPIRYGLGMGIDLSRFCLDYCFLEHPVLGGTHRIGLSFSLKN